MKCTSFGRITSLYNNPLALSEFMPSIYGHNGLDATPLADSGSKG